jgi:hypothetical protein
MTIVTDNPADKKQARMFVGARLVANSAVASTGAGAAMFVTTGLVLPAIAAAAVGAYLGFSLTNDIPKGGD